jgi:hypothetical protein
MGAEGVQAKTVAALIEGAGALWGGEELGARASSFGDDRPEGAQHRTLAQPTEGASSTRACGVEAAGDEGCTVQERKSRVHGCRVVE